jgi:hypothetical protein
MSEDWVNVGTTLSGDATDAPLETPVSEGIPTSPAPQQGEDGGVADGVVTNSGSSGAPSEGLPSVGFSHEEMAIEVPDDGDSDSCGMNPRTEDSICFPDLKNMYQLLLEMKKQQDMQIKRIETLEELFMKDRVQVVEPTESAGAETESQKTLPFPLNEGPGVFEDINSKFYWLWGRFRVILCF